MSEWDAVSKPASASEWDAVSRLDRRKAAAPAAPKPSYDPSEGMSGWEKALVGAGYATDKAIRGVKGLFGADTTAQDEDAKLYEKHRPKGWQTTAGEIAGTIGTQAPLAMIPGGLPVQMAAQAAGSAAMTPGDAATRAKEGALGAAGAGAGHVLTKTLGRAFQPVGTKADDIRTLERAGVEPTLGQSLAATGTAQGRAAGRLEESLQSVPFAGGPLRRTRETAKDQWRAMTREAAMPADFSGVGARAPASVDEVIEATGRAYDDALAGHGLPYASVQYQPDMRRLTSGMAISPENRQMVQETFEQLRLDRMSNPTPGVQAGADAAQQVESALKKKAVMFQNSLDPAQKEIGHAYMALARDYGQTWRGSLPPDTAARVAAIDRGYPRRLALQKAAINAPIKGGEGVADNFSPVGLAQASRSTDNIPGKRNFIRGEAPLQEEARLGLHLEPRVADSGTPERIASLTGLGTAGAAALGGNVAPLAGGAALGGAVAAYGTRPVQQYLTGRAFPTQQQFMLDLLRNRAPLGAAAGAGAATSIYGE